MIKKMVIQEETLDVSNVQKQHIRSKKINDQNRNNIGHGKIDSRYRNQINDDGTKLF